LVEPGAYKTDIWNSGSQTMEAHYRKDARIQKLFSLLIHFSSQSDSFSQKMLNILTFALLG